MLGDFHARLLAHYSYHRHQHADDCEFCQQDERITLYLNSRMNTDDLIQYVITFGALDNNPREKLHIVRAGRASEIGRVVAAHINIGAVRLVIPSTHVKANFAQEAPIVEVWVDKRVADG